MMRDRLVVTQSSLPVGVPGWNWRRKKRRKRKGKKLKRIREAGKERRIRENQEGRDMNGKWLALKAVQKPVEEVSIYLVVFTSCIYLIILI